jgi:hypothetical protein
MPDGPGETQTSVGVSLSFLIFEDGVRGGRRGRRRRGDGRVRLICG